MQSAAMSVPIDAQLTTGMSPFMCMARHVRVPGFCGSTYVNPNA